MATQMLQFMLHFFFGHINIFRRSYAVHDELSLYIVFGAVLVFADVIDDFVLVRYLSGNASTEPVSVKIYNTARAAPTPALNALATLLLLAALAAVVVGFLIFRRLTRGDGTTDRGIGAFAGEA